MHTRRDFMYMAPVGVAGLLGLSSFADRRSVEEVSAPYDAFPRQNPSLVSRTVGLSHRSFDGVKELVEASPALANAAIDWGFGDWETALGAASHTGRRNIAELLLKHGARPDIFTHAMMGHVDVIQGIVKASPGIQSLAGPHGISLMRHARAGREQAALVVEYLEELGGADPQVSSNELDHTPEAFSGKFRYGPEETQLFEISQNEGDKLMQLARGDMFPRRLIYMGNEEFHPGGVPHVRIKFHFTDGVANEVSVLDPGLIVKGIRMA